MVQPTSNNIAHNYKPITDVQTNPDPHPISPIKGKLLQIIVTSYRSGDQISDIT